MVLQRRGRDNVCLSLCAPVGLLEMNLPEARCAGAMREALRLHTIKCSIANAFFIRAGGLGCRLKREGPGAREAERAKEGRRERVAPAVIFTPTLYSLTSHNFLEFNLSVYERQMSQNTQDSCVYIGQTCTFFHFINVANRHP